MGDDLRGEDRMFRVVCELPNARMRAEYLDYVCGEDQNLRKRIELRLTSHPALAVSATPKEPVPPATIDIPLLPARPGSAVGPYRLMEQIGEGGRGAVFLAEQQRPIHPKVAIKIIKPGMDSKVVVARFEAERQALALMDHPNIAKVLDAGTTDSGRPYFAMELDAESLLPPTVMTIGCR